MLRPSLIFPGWTYSAAGSLVRMSAAQAKAQASPELSQDSGDTSPESSAKSTRGSLSSKTSPVVNADGCQRCVEICTCLATTPLPMRFLRTTSERYTCGEGSSLLPTPSASSYGSNRGGAKGRTGKVRYSLAALASRGQLAIHPRGPLSPIFVEWLMGFPIGWTDLKHSETPSYLSAPKQSGE